MYNIDAGDVNKRLATLSAQERSVLRLRCEAVDYKTIATTLSIALPTVKQYMSRIYVKLGLDQLSRTERIKALFETFCPVFQELPSPWIEGEFVKDPIPLLDEERTEEPISSSVKDMIDEDEHAVAPIRTKETTPEPRFRGFRILVIGVILGICLGGSVVLWFFRGNLPINLPSSEETPTSSIAVLGITNSPTLPPTEVVTQTPVIIVVTATSAPATEVPSLTPRPQSVVLFEDNFDQGLSGSWSVISGNPVIVNGQLTSDEDTWIQIGDNSWVNYRIELDVVPKDCWFSWSSSAIGVRVKDASNMNAFKLAACEHEWDSVKNGTSIPVPNSHETRAGSSEMKIVITVNGDQYSVDLNGERISSFFNSDYPQGGIAIKIGPETMFDNLKVSVIQ
jgi:hypothetical protein